MAVNASRLRRHHPYAPARALSRQTHAPKQDRAFQAIAAAFSAAAVCAVAWSIMERLAGG